MKDLSELDQLLDAVANRLSEAASTQARLEEELLKAKKLYEEESLRTKKLLEEKELEKIRAVKEKDQIIDELGREKMALQKEKEALEGRIDEFFAKVRALIPGASAFERRQA